MSKNRSILGHTSRRCFLEQSSKWSLAAGLAAPATRLLGQQNVEVQDSDTEVEVQGTDAAGESSERLTYESPQTQFWRIGLTLETPVTCSNVLATFAVPMAWPEQKVEVVGRKIGAAVTQWDVRNLPGGARQVIVQMARVPAGSKVDAIFEFKIERSRILGPESTSDLVIPTRPSRDLRLFMGNSPYIDASHGRIRAASRELEAMESENAWQKVEQIYDYVREKVEYVEGSLKNASEAAH